jgi:hypothetical protein
MSRFVPSYDGRLILLPFIDEVKQWDIGQLQCVHNIIVIWNAVVSLYVCDS